MHLEITFRNIDPSDAIREKAEKRFAKVARYLREPVEAHLVMKVEKHRHSAEVTVHAAGDQHFSVHDVTENMYVTLDQVMARLEEAVKRARERQIDRHHNSGVWAQGRTGEL
jgi:putative sigma-54 modulation protein